MSFQHFHDLHHAARPLVLPNAWDAASARLMHHLGAAAIATTSAGLAWSLGYPDGDRLPLAEYASALRRIVRVTPLPVSADAEGGYSDAAGRAAEAVAALADTGIVGINLEDGGGPPELLARKIEAIKSGAARRGQPLFVNARTDVLLRGLAPGRAVQETLARARLYAGAGADALFVPGATAPADIAALVAGQPLPLAVMARAGLPPLQALADLGVRRLSAGSGLAQLAWGTVARAAQGFLADGASEPLLAGAADYAAINALFQA